MPLQSLIGDGIPMRIAFVGQLEAQAAIIRLLHARGHAVHRFEDARRALETIRSDLGIDLLVTYGSTGSMSGFELCWEARLIADDARPLYILFVVPSGEETIKVEALDCGADEALDERAHPEELHAKLRVAERIVSLQRTLIRRASTDCLSGADNREAFFRTLTKACDDASRGGVLSVIYLDVDNFKAINDRYGHDVGDEALRTIATIAGQLGAPVGRLGGDEFSVILAHRDLPEAREMASTLKQRISAVRLQTPEGRVGIACSYGVSTFEAGDTADDLIKRADLALYQAKHSGGNCVATTPEDSWMNARPSLGVSLVRLLPRPSPEIRERRNRQPASDGLLARVCAVVDLLIASGLDKDAACEAMAQRVIAAEVPLPEGAERSDWPSVLYKQREALRHGVSTNQVLIEYKSVVAAIDAVAPHARVAWALETELWDRRRVRSGITRPAWTPTSQSTKQREEDQLRLVSSEESISQAAS